MNIGLYGGIGVTEIISNRINDLNVGVCPVSYSQCALELVQRCCTPQ